MTDRNLLAATVRSISERSNSLRNRDGQVWLFYERDRRKLMSHCVTERRHNTPVDSKETSGVEGFWTLMSTVSAGPSFVQMKGRSKVPGRVQDAVRIRKYFKTAKSKMKTNGVEG